MKKADIMRRVGDISQIAGVKRYQLTQGKADGLRACDVETGSGLSFTVLESRCMDISKLQYKGTNISFISKGSLVGYPDTFPKIFRGGMLYTCGLLNVGPGDIDNGKQLDVHGSIGRTPAENVAVMSKWFEDDYLIDIYGEIKESALFGENLSLKRHISTCMGSKSLKIHDEVENLGFEEQEIMLLYHFNIGYPLLDQGSKVLIPSIDTIPRDSDAEPGLSQSSEISTPIDGFREQVFYHNVACDKNGDTYSAVINDAINLGVYIKYNKNQLPELIQWKSMNSGDYVIGLEPANCRVGGKAEERSRGALQKIKPQQVMSFDLEIGILDGKEEIETFSAHRILYV